MTHYEIYQAAQARLATAQARHASSPSPATESALHEAQAVASASARNLRREEILAMPSSWKRSSLLEPLGSDMEQVSLPTEEESLLERYQARALAAPRVMARWAAYNDAKLTSGEWALQDFQKFMAQVGPVVILLNSLAFGATAAAVQAFSHPLATDEAKADYLAMMDAEGALPS